jgi:hypothetical protein
MVAGSRTSGWLDRAFTRWIPFESFRIPNGDSGRPGKLVSKSKTKDGAVAPDKASRPFMALVLVFVTAFAAATSAQIRAHHDIAAETIVAAQASAAGLITERVNANMAVAVGASASAAELARTSGVDAYAVANAAAHAQPAIAAAVVNSAGGIEAITSGDHAALIRAAMETASSTGVWIGAPDMGELQTTPVIVRHIGARAIVTVVDATQLLPELEPSTRVLIASPDGAVIYASPALQRAGVHGQARPAG